MNTSSYGRLVTAVRLLLGTVLFVNGLNWWVKLITPYPSISDGVAWMPPGDFVAAMINTGIIFHLVKGLELLAGVALLLNRCVPLALVAVLSVTINVFIVDVFLGHRLRAYIMGSGALLMNVFLMLAYFERYRALLLVHATPDVQLPATAPLLRVARPILAVAAAIIGTIMVGWVAVMIVQHFAG
jgi:hypothetical protein